MKIFGVTGGSSDQKTDLLIDLVPELANRGISVATVKYVGHEFDVDRPGKDSFTHREAGATEVVVLSAKRFAVLHENREQQAPDLDELIGHMTPVDLVLALGFHDHPHDKLEIRHADQESPDPPGGNPRIVVIASETPIAESALPPHKPRLFGIRDIGGIADFIVRHLALERA